MSDNDPVPLADLIHFLRSVVASAESEDDYPVDAREILAMLGEDGDK